jgi:hypothetical protein
MKYRVILTFDVESEEYEEVEPTEESVRGLVQSMLIRDADLPDYIQIDVKPEWTPEEIMTKEG